MIPGEVFLGDGDVELNSGRETRKLRVDNLGDRPIQVGSHSHFFEVNQSLRFDREQAYGFRLNVPSGTALRFEPGESREIEIVAIAGDRCVFGMNAKVQGSLEEKRAAALDGMADSSQREAGR
ncbi:MAG: urease subunit beta [Bryobacterales bacterium]